MYKMWSLKSGPRYIFGLRRSFGYRTAKKPLFKKSNESKSEPLLCPTLVHVLLGCFSFPGVIMRYKILRILNQTRLMILAPSLDYFSVFVVTSSMAEEDEEEWSEDEVPEMPVSAKRAHRNWTPDEKLNVHAYAVKRMRLDDDPPSSRRALFKEIEERFKMKRATVEDVLLQVESGEPLEQIVKQPYLNVEDEQSFFHAHALMEKNKVFITQDVL
jgi:hypothetical protein